MNASASRYSLSFMAAAICVSMVTSPMAGNAFAQAVKGSVSADDSPPALTYHGLVPGLDTMEKVKAVLGEPVFESRWYNYKLYYPAKDRDGYFDIVHMHGNKPDSGLAEVEAVSVPPGFETEDAIRADLGEPEYELRMATWKLLDYGAQGVRFALTPDGNTIGVAYVPHLYRRVPPGERAFVDLSGLRQGPQPAPPRPASLNGLKAGAAEVEHSPSGHAELVFRVAQFRANRVLGFEAGRDAHCFDLCETRCGSGAVHVNNVEETFPPFDGVVHFVVVPFRRVRRFAEHFFYLIHLVQAGYQAVVRECRWRIVGGDGSLCRLCEGVTGQWQSDYAYTDNGSHER